MKEQAESIKSEVVASIKNVNIIFNIMININNFSC